MANKSKKKIVGLLLNKEVTDQDEEELLNLLIDEPIAIDVDKLDAQNRTKGDEIADKITSFAGSWKFIIGFSLFLILWILLNALEIIKIDKYPFILLNLLLSCLAALQAPIIMMSQNRASEKDSLRNLNDYKTDLKSELLLEQIHNTLNNILANQKNMQKQINDMKEKLNNQNKRPND